MSSLYQPGSAPSPIRGRRSAVIPKASAGALARALNMLGTTPRSARRWSYKSMTSSEIWSRSSKGTRAIEDGGGGCHRSSPVGSCYVRFRTEQDGCLLGRRIRSFIKSKHESATGVEALAHALHDAEVVGKVVDGVECAGERLTALHQVT